MIRLVNRLAEAFFAKLVTSLARSRTRLIKARARSLTIGIENSHLMSLQSLTTTLEDTILKSLSSPDKQSCEFCVDVDSICYTVGKV